MPWWSYLVLAVILVALVVWASYNMSVKGRNQAREAWSGVNVQLKRRRDLVPNLVSAVSAYAGHEQSVLQLTTEARLVADAADHSNPSSAAPAENNLTGALRGLFVSVERYPELKADANFLALQRELVNIENNVQAARAIYNSNARSYNDRIQSFPAVLFIGAFGFRSLTYVESAASDKGVGRIDFT
jgi:LemA protein